MEFFSAKQLWRWVYRIALILLACLVALLWQRFGDSSTINLTSPHQVEVKVEEPIQPIPLSLVLD